MELILAVLVGGGCIALGRWAIRRQRSVAQRASRAPSAEELDRGLEDLRPGDVVTHDGADYIVAGVARLTEGSDSWLECRLEDVAREAWIVIHPIDPDAVIVGERVTDMEVAGERPSESVDHQGQVFRLERHGRASVETDGDLGEGLRLGE